MNSCDHHTWLQLLETTEPALCDTGRLDRLLPELSDARRQEPTLLLFIGRKAKDIALRELFPWNNVKKGRRDGMASLRIDNTTVDSQHPVLFAESDPFASIMSHPEKLLSCHRSKTFPIHWNSRAEGNIYDLIHARLFCLFADVLCLFADDFDSLDAVVDRLKAWTTFGIASDQLAQIKPTVIVVVKGSGASPSPTYDLLEKLDIQFSLLQRELVQFFSSIVVLHLADEQISPLARHRRLKELIRRQVVEKRHIRQTHGCLYTAIHLGDLFTKAVAHTALTLSEKYSFLSSSRQPIVENTQYLADFMGLCVRHNVHYDDMVTFVASTLLLDAYPAGMHKFDPVHVYDLVYLPSCLCSLEANYHAKQVVKGLSDAILDRFTGLFGDMHNLKTTANELHVASMRCAAIPWSMFRTSRTCLHCLRRRPEHVLTCGHSICDACVQKFGDPLAHAEYQYQIDRCLLCNSGSLNITLHPPTAGFRLLSVDGGGIRGVIPLEILRHLQDTIGPACKVQDLFDLAVGTSSGIVPSGAGKLASPQVTVLIFLGGLIVLGMFLRRWSVSQCARNFDTLTRQFFQAQERSRGGLVRCLRRVIKCWMCDAYYDAANFEKMLKNVFGERNRMFDARPSTSNTRVAVVATTISDALPFVFSNYNGTTERNRDSGYLHLRPKESKNEPRIWEALFRPVHIPEIGTFQDGGLKHNNPINLALWESRHIWPAIEKPDMVVSLGTGTAKSVSTPTAPQFRHVISDGFIPRLWRSFMSSLDGQSTWRDLWNRLDSVSRQDFFRLNVFMSGDGPRMDDVDQMNELRECVELQLGEGRMYEQTVFALLASSYFFELNSTPLFYGGRYYCKGTIRCRLPGKALCRTMENVHPAKLAFMTDDEIVGYFLASDDLCGGCSRYSKPVEFVTRHPGEAISIYLQSCDWGKRRISGFPQDMQWFVRQQQLEAHLRPEDEKRIAACHGCRASVSKHHSAMPKRKMTEHSADEGRPIRKRLRSGTALNSWER